MDNLLSDHTSSITVILVFKTMVRNNSNCITSTILLKLVLVVVISIYICYSITVNLENNLVILLLAVLAVVYMSSAVLWHQPTTKVFCKNAIRTVFDSLAKHWIGRNLQRCLIVVLLCGCLVFLVVDARSSPRRFVSLAGIFFFLLVSFIISTNPAKVSFSPVLSGVLLQLLLGLFILRWRPGYQALTWLSDAITTFVRYGRYGAEFVFGAYHQHPFAMEVMSLLIFFASVTRLLYHLGVMQKVVLLIGRCISLVMETSVAESFVAAANIFLGPETSVQMVRPMVPDMSTSQLHAVMAAGMSTIGGGLLAFYASQGVPANHMVAASFMSAPAALAVAKVLCPEENGRKQDNLKLTKREDRNGIEAICQGAIAALPVAGFIVVNLIAVQSSLAFVNSTITWFGARLGIENLTFQYILSFPLVPVTFLLGVDWEDCRQVAELIGIKTVLNEFIAYSQLAKLIKNRQMGLLPSLSVRSENIATYALCGYSNIGTVGSTLGFMTAVAPGKAGNISRVAVRALICGNIACLMTASIAGLLSS